MIMMSLKFTDQVPFRDVYITGLIRDAEGHKMSKSKGNVLDPIDLIDGIDVDSLIAKRTYGLMQPKMAEKIAKATSKEFPQGIPSYGTDALRYTFCSFASYTREIRFDIGRLGGYRNFCNKLWNAARYVLMTTEGKDVGLGAKKITVSIIDHWIVSRLQYVTKEAQLTLADYRFDLFSQTLYDFVWNEYCDWYLELSKVILTSADYTAEIQQGTRYTLIYVLEQILRLLHPITPFITEALWQKIAPLAGKEGPSIMLAPYPQFDASIIDEASLKEIEWVKKFVMAIRSIRSGMNIPPGKMLPVLLRHGESHDKTNVKHHNNILRTLAKLETINWLADKKDPPESASAFLGELEIFIPLAGLVDKKEEKNRLQREIDKLQKEISQLENKLANPTFSSKAPPEVVKKEQEKFAAAKLKMEKLKQQMEGF